MVLFTVTELSRDFAGGQMEIRLTAAGKGEYRKKGADTWLPFSATKIILVAEVWITWSYDGRKCTSQKITYTFNRNDDGSWTWEVISTEGNDGFVAGSSASGSTIWHHLKILSIEVL